MCHQRQPLNQRSHTRPYLGKNLRTVRILMPQPMHPLTIPTVIIGLWLYQTIKRLLHLAVANHYHPNTAHAAPLAVGGLEIYGCKILHISLSIYWQLQSHVSYNNMSMPFYNANFYKVL